MLEIKVSSEMGRGVYATEDIGPGVIVEKCEILALSELDTDQVNSTDLQFYTFKLDESRDCLVLGNGEIYNHDDKPNVSYTIIQVNNRPIMLFMSRVSIKKGEQLFINYGEDTVGLNLAPYQDTVSLMR